jgi:hypothetical protein
MKEIISISDFLRTGKFGKVMTGDSLATVIDKLGVPDGHMNIAKPFKGIHYNGYEFVFDGHGLRSIQNDNCNRYSPGLSEFENDKIKVNTEFLGGEVIKKLGEIQKTLKNLRIEFSMVDYWERKVLRTEGNVIIDFNDEKWSDQDRDWVKIKNHEDLEFIGIRYYPKEE